MRAELEEQFNKHAPAVMKRVIELRRADADKDEAERQASEMVHELIWSHLSPELREEMFCHCIALMMIKIACEQDDAERHKNGECDCGKADDMEPPPEILELMKKIAGVSDSGMLVGIKVTRVKK